MMWRHCGHVHVAISAQAALLLNKKMLKKTHSKRVQRLYLFKTWTAITTQRFSHNQHHKFTLSIHAHLASSETKYIFHAQQTIAPRLPVYFELKNCTTWNHISHEKPNPMKSQFQPKSNCRLHWNEIAHTLLCIFACTCVQCGRVRVHIYKLVQWQSDISQHNMIC